jgi:hypothetical protein
MSDSDACRALWNPKSDFIWCLSLTYWSMPSWMLSQRTRSLFVWNSSRQCMLMIHPLTMRLWKTPRMSLIRKLILMILHHVRVSSKIPSTDPPWF